MSDEKQFEVWITRYALVSGITKFAVVKADGDRVEVERDHSRLWPYYHGEGREWHRTQESAITKAEEMRKRKIASLKKQIEKLEKLDFSKIKDS